jgi:four helix bundle protein
VRHEDWLKEVPSEITQDALWRMEVYRLAIFAGDLAWHDTARLVRDRRMVALSNQLFRAVGSVGANIAEGYSRQSGRDQARFCEHALGSAREARVWYYQGRHALRDEVAIHRIGLLVQITRLLLSSSRCSADPGSARRRSPTLQHLTARWMTHPCPSRYQICSQLAIRNTQYGTLTQLASRSTNHETHQTRKGASRVT